MKRKQRWIGAALVLFGYAAACGDQDDRALTMEAGTEAGLPESTVASAGVIDSVLPMDVALGRFRADLREPAALGHGRPSRDALVRAIVDALAASDTAALGELAVDRAEYAWLYFPTAPLASPPYELPPGLAWFQLQERNRIGVFRALREMGGNDLTLQAYACAPEPRAEGENRLWVDCSVTIRRQGSEPLSLRLVESILERDGRFAVLSYANDF